MRASIGRTVEECRFSHRVQAEIVAATYLLLLLLAIHLVSNNLARLQPEMGS